MAYLCYSIHTRHTMRSENTLKAKLGDLGNWRFTGNVKYNDDHDGAVDLPRCECGQPIHYSHQIKNTITGETAYVGSECVSLFKRHYNARFSPSDARANALYKHEYNRQQKGN